MSASSNSNNAFYDELRLSLQRDNIAQDEDGSNGSGNSSNNYDFASHALQPIPSSPQAQATKSTSTSLPNHHSSSQSSSSIPNTHTSPTPSSASTELANERQTLLLMLLGQVCSLHDATPRTFVVHVIALYERGILDSNSIQFLFDLGLVPRGYDLGKIAPATGDGSASSDVGNKEGVDYSSEGTEKSSTSTSSWSNNNEGAIVPYCEQVAQHPWARYFPPLPLPTSNNEGSSTKRENSSNHHSSTSTSSDNLHSEKMAHRQTHASAIRQHLERHESIDSSAHGSTFGSAPAMQSSSSTTSMAPPTAATTTANKDRWNRANSSVTQNTLHSADESFDNPSYRPHTIPHNEMSNAPGTSTQHQQAITAYIPPTSWSVEHHPLSLSRYQREFHQLSLLATGSFGSVYHALHKLEQKPYAVKCVTFNTMGYYANALTLVIREVRCLAQLNHPNCVRYYTSWLEPSWMTGNDANDNINFVNDEDGEDESSIPQHGKGCSPKLLTDIERVIQGLHDNDEIDNSVEQLEALLYLNNDGDNTMDDGFNWASSSAGASKHDEQKESMKDDDDWDNLPSYRTTNNHHDVDGDDSDESEWTHDLNANSSGSTAERQSFHNPREYARQKSLELVPAGRRPHDNNNNRPDQYNRQSSASSRSASATYKYQISLYIQMQLCNPSTLADWIKQRNLNCLQFNAEERQARARPAFEVFRQIVNGLAHVHTQGIIHRDLKPANIFAGDDGSFMVGDFGLSKMMRDVNSREKDADLHSNAIILPPGYSNGIHTAGVGTASYASPEQVETKTYGTAADIYSLGLILLELFSNFTSEHERAKAFHDCRHNREIPPSMKRYYPEVSALILACTQTDWNRRPSSSDIQAAAVFKEVGTSAEIFKAELRALKADMTRKDILIQHQKDELTEMDEIIDALRRRLGELNVPDVVTGTDPNGDSACGSRSSDDDY